MTVMHDHSLCIPVPNSSIPSPIAALRTYYAQQRSRLKRWGLRNTAEVLLFDASNRMIYLEILRVMRLSKERVNPKYLRDDPPYTFRFLSAHEIERFAEDPAHDLRPYYLRAISRGDVCFAALDGDRLVAYSWYSRVPTEITGEFRARFSEPYRYAYHIFSHPSYRGQHLHCYMMARALDQLQREEPVQLISVVSVSNVSSFRAMCRVGNSHVGWVAIAGRLNTYVVRMSSSLKCCGFSVEATRDDFRVIKVGDRRD